MKKVLIVIIVVLLITGCSATSKTSKKTLSTASGIETSAITPSQVSQMLSSATSIVISSAPSVTSEESESELTGIDLYMKCFNEGKFDIYNLKIGDPIQNAIDEFGQGEKGYYGLGGICYTYNDVVIAFAEGTESFANRVEIIDIIGEGITAYGITTGKSTTEDVKKILGESDDTGHYTYEMSKTMEDPYDFDEQYCVISYYNKNKDLWCYVDFFFDNDVLKVISLGTLTNLL